MSLVLGLFILLLVFCVLLLGFWALALSMSLTLSVVSSFWVMLPSLGSSVWCCFSLLFLLVGAAFSLLFWCGVPFSLSLEGGVAFLPCPLAGGCLGGAGVVLLSPRVWCCLLLALLSPPPLWVVLFCPSPSVLWFNVLFVSKKISGSEVSRCPNFVVRRFICSVRLGR